MFLSHYFSRIKKNFWRYPNARGFSLVELLVVLSIAIIITTLVLLNYPRFGANQALNISAQEVAQVIREAQLYGISVKGSDGTTFPSYGVYLGDSTLNALNPNYPERIIIFADSFPAQTTDLVTGEVITPMGNGIYDVGQDKIDRTYNIISPSYIYTICYSDNTGTTYYGYGCNVATPVVKEVNIIYKRPNPEPIITVTPDVGPPFPVAVLKIVLNGPTGGVEVFTSKYGQVSVGGFKASPATTCPYLYSWDGTKFVYEHRGLALSGIGKKQTNVRMLRSVVPIDSKLTFKVFEDYDETHLDALNVTAIDIPSSSQAVVYPDTSGQFRTFKNGITPLSCESGGVDCLEGISHFADQKELYFGTVTKEEGSPKSSEAILNFPVPSGTKEAKLLLKLKTDDSLYKIWPNLYKAIGPFVFEVMANEELRKIFNVDETINSFALKVDVWDGEKWKAMAGEVPSDLKSPEELLFSINNISTPSTELRLRVRSLFRYHLDYISLDRSPDDPMKITTVPIEKALYEGIKESEGLLEGITSSGDGKEAVISAGNSIQAVFVDPVKNKDTKRSYASSFSGYYIQKKPETIDYSFNPWALLDAYKALNQSEGASQYLFEKYAK